MSSQDFEFILTYLGLPEDYSPSPQTEPLKFLGLHLHSLPLHRTPAFSAVTTPRERTSIRAIKNRRTQYALSEPKQLQWEQGRQLEPTIWESMNSTTAARGPAPRAGIEAASQEREWTEQSFIGFQNISTRIGEPGPKRGHVGRLGELLAEYEEEREAERVRTFRRERMAAAAAEHEIEEEFDEDSSDSDDEPSPSADVEVESPDEVRKSFERVIRERFIDGYLPSDIYAEVDYDDHWDPDNREDEDRWFDDEEES